MKQIIILILLFAFTSTAFSQQTNTAHNSVNIDYLRKSKTQKTFAWILTGVGVTVVTVGALTQGYVDAFTGFAYEKNTVSPIVYAIGGSCIAGGIILFSAAARNKRKSTNSTVYFNTQLTMETTMIKSGQKNFPALGFAIRF